jgi:hypothetical protein
MNHTLAGLLGRLPLRAGKHLTGRRKITLTTPSNDRRVRDRCVFCGNTRTRRKIGLQSCFAPTLTSGNSL